jgi:uncharacterized protein YxjI
MSVVYDNGAPLSRRFSLRMGLGGIDPDPWIEDADGRRVFHVDEMARARMDTFILRDPHGREVAKLEENLSGQDTTVIEREGATLATVRRSRAGLRHRFVIDVVGGATLEVHGHVGRHKYEIRRGEDIVATISTEWVQGHDRYGVELAAGEDEAMLIAATVAIDGLENA